jgi:hypothetical protein
MYLTIYFQDWAYEKKKSGCATGLNFILYLSQIRSSYLITAVQKQVLFSFSCSKGERSRVLQDFLKVFASVT